MTDFEKYRADKGERWQDTEMVDRMAEVIAQSLGMYGLLRNSKPVNVATRFAARTVLQLLAEATPEMIEAGASNLPRGRASTPLDVWKAMIDEAYGRNRHA